MTCSECQVEIFDGEVGRDGLVHLTECAKCRALDREVRLNAVALAELRQEVLPLRARRWFVPKGLDLRWVASLAAAAVLAALVWETGRRDPEMVSVKQTFRFPEVPRVEAPKPVMPTASAPRRVATRRRRPEPVMPLPAEQVLIQLFTDDPEVVIYLVPDPIEGEQAL